jgi:hypothetical protein
MSNLIGVCGFARAGKNSFADFIKSLQKEMEPRPAKIEALSFAYPLRKELEDFVQQRLGISTFTENLKEKEIIRPLLVCWGTEIMRNQIDPDYWIKKMEKAVETNRKSKITSIITDVRFQNEIEWIRSQGGKTIFVNRENVGPINKDETRFTLPLQHKCDLIFNWPTLSNFENAGRLLVKEFLTKNNLCHLITPTSSLPTT